MLLVYIGNDIVYVDGVQKIPLKIELKLLIFLLHKRSLGSTSRNDFFIILFLAVTKKNINPILLN